MFSPQLLTKVIVRTADLELLLMTEEVDWVLRISCPMSWCSLTETAPLVAAVVNVPVTTQACAAPGKSVDVQSVYVCV